MNKTVAVFLSLIFFIGLSACQGTKPKGKILKVHAGDVFEVPSTFSAAHSVPMRVKLLAVSCPRVDSNELIEAYYGALALNFSKKWIKNKWVFLERPVKKSSGLPQRKFAFVQDSKSKEYLHEVLVSEGLAQVDFQSRDFGEKNSRLLALEKEAVSASKGLWTKKHPKEYEMMEVINESRPLLKKLANAVTGKKWNPRKNREQREPVEKPQPVQKSQPEVKALRAALRQLKIQIEDILDDFEDELSPSQKKRLKAYQEEMTEMMRIIKNN
jgi:endonuclease YncB( thermonuclease family)